MRLRQHSSCGPLPDATQTNTRRVGPACSPRRATPNAWTLRARGRGYAQGRARARDCNGRTQARGSARAAGAEGQSVALARKVLKLIPVPISFWRLTGTLFRLAQAAAATATADPPPQLKYQPCASSESALQPFY